MSPIARFARDSSYLMIAAVLNIAIALGLSLIVPKLVDVREFGFWQLFVLYSMYLGFAHFGWPDGVYLRYGGQAYGTLPREILRPQLWFFIALQAAIGFVVAVLGWVLTSPGQRRIVLASVGLALVLTNVRLAFLYVLQATSRFRDAALVQVVDRIVFVVLAVTQIVRDGAGLEDLICSDLAARGISLLLAAALCLGLVGRGRGSARGTRSSWRGEYWQNVSGGFKLMVSGTASLLIIGSARFAIEHSWGVDVFANVSLILSVSSFVLVLLNSIGLVVFPAVRRLDSTRAASVYRPASALVSVALAWCMAFYFVLELVLRAWLPSYELAWSLLFMAFPLCLFEGRLALMIYPYLKSERMEKQMLSVNVLALVASLVGVLVGAMVLRNLALTLGLVVLIDGVRCGVFDKLVCDRLGVGGAWGRFAGDAIVVAVFVACASVLMDPFGAGPYLFFAALVTFARRRAWTLAAEGLREGHVSRV